LVIALDDNAICINSGNLLKAYYTEAIMKRTSDAARQWRLQPARNPPDKGYYYFTPPDSAGDLE
jgi:hypothetical protein